ncbi:MAG: hypothetical protein WC223_01570 [Bacteroidales bacterium]|jgi:hypothetical protein
MKNTSNAYFIKEIINKNEFAEPFNDSFDLKLFINEIKEYLKKSKDLKDECNKSSADSVDAIILLNIVHNDLSRKIEDLIEKIDLPNIELINYILAITNSNFFIISNEIINQNKKEKTNSISNNDDLSQIKLKDIYGAEVDVVSANDDSIDTCNELIRKIISYNYTTKTNQQINEERITNIFKIFHLANILTNIKNAYNYYKYEFGELTKGNDEEIKIKNIPEIYYYFKLAGIDRTRNIIRENAYYGKKI